MNYVVELEGGDRWEVSIDSDEPTCVKVQGEARSVELETRPDGTLLARVDGRAQVVRLKYEDGFLLVETPDGRKRKVRVEKASAHAWRKLVSEQPRAAASLGPSELRAPIAGSIAALLVAEGARVERGQPVLKLEAMKMLNSIATPAGGKIRFEVQAGQTVLAGTVLARIDSGEES